jgi:hypothetical protein
MNKDSLVLIACLSLAAVNIAGFKYLGVFGLFVTAASVPFAEKLLTIISTLP